MGLDLGLVITGIALPDRVTTKRGSLKGVLRLIDIRDTVCRLVVAEHIDLVVLEDYAFHAKDAHAHELGELGGAVKVGLHERTPQARVVLVKPNLRTKYATGKGNASKDNVLVEAVRRLGYDGASKDEADALWLQQMGLAATGREHVTLPETHTAALRSITWPELAGSGAW